MRFSLVIPVAPDRGAEIIDSIQKVDYPKSEMQVIVVRGLNASRNRNRGAEIAKGEIIGFLDDDAIIEGDFLRNVDEFFKRYEGVDVVGGPQLTPKDAKGFGKISGYALTSKFGAWKLSNRYDITKTNLNADECSVTSANLFVKREVMKKIKFDESLWPGEDPKFIEDAQNKGFSIACTPGFVVYHKRRPTIRGLVKQMFNYGKVRPKKEGFFTTLKNPFFFVPSLFFIYLAVLILSVLIKPSITGNVVSTSLSGGGWFVWPLILYVLLALLFGVFDSLRNRDLKAIFVLPGIYPMIHLSYGAGMIWGYLRKFI